MSERCPVCFATFKTLENFQAHVQSHFDSPAPASAVPNPDDVMCPYGCGKRVKIVDLDAHEAEHRLCADKALASKEQAVLDAALAAAIQREEGVEQKDTVAATASAQAVTAAHGSDSKADAKRGSTGSCNEVFCKLCRQWVPLTELASHELVHEMLGEVAHVHGEGDGGAANEDLRALLRQNLGTEGWDAGVRADGLHLGFDEEEDEVDGDLEVVRQLQEQADFEALRVRYGFAQAPRTGNCHVCGEPGHWATECPLNPSSSINTFHGPLSTDPQVLAAQQRPESTAFLTGPTGRVNELLAARLVAAAAAADRGGRPVPGYCAWLSGPVSHLSSTSADKGWGCGWRNIQMQLSHLLQAGSEQLIASLFHGAAYIPTISSLQAWLEVAWAAGFDVPGCESLGGKIQGDTKWIGSTEAATLLRYQGVRMEVVDFIGYGQAVGLQHLPDGHTVHAGVACDVCGQCPILGVRFRSCTKSNFDLCEACAAKPDAAYAAPFDQVGASGMHTQVPDGQQTAQQQQRQVAQQQHSSQQRGSHRHIALLRWVWHYFTGTHAPTQHMHRPRCITQAEAEAVLRGQPLPPPAAAQPQHLQRSTGAAAPQVMLTGMAPLYWQHEGHSRTIIGIERKPIQAVNGKRGPGAQGGRGVGEAPARAKGAGPAAATRQHMQPITSFFAPTKGSQQRGDSAGGGLDLACPVSGIGTDEGHASGNGNGAAAGSTAGPHATAGSTAAVHTESDVDLERYVYTLLVLDPGIPVASLAACLKSGQQWQKLLRRGLHTLRAPQYQLVYCGMEVMGPQEREASKVVRASEVYRAQQSGAAQP